MVWDTIKESLRKRLGENIYRLWIEPIQFTQFEGGDLYLKCPDRYFVAYVKQNFFKYIEEDLKKASSDQGKVILQEDDASDVVIKSMSNNSGKKQLRLPTIPENKSRSRSLHPRYTFGEFMVGDSNILAQSACKAMVAKDEMVGPCLYINSETGLGKSHLTHAVAHKIFSKSPMTRLFYLTAQQYSLEMVDGIKNNNMTQFKKKYHDNCDVLLIEDIHSLTNKKKTQEELNELLDHLIKTGKRVILTSKKAPRDLEGIDNEFLSRMSSGLVTSIKAPDTKTRLRIVTKKAAQLKLQLDEDHVRFLAKHIRGDVRRIESALVAIKARANLTGGYIDFDMVKESITCIVDINQSVNTGKICDLVSGQFQVSVQDLCSKSRKKTVTVPRQIAMYLARKHTEQSLAEIGRVFKRDHSTVLHAIKVVSDKLIRDASVNAQIDLLSEKVLKL